MSAQQTGRIALSPQAAQEAAMQQQAAMQERAAKNQATFASKQIRINTACAILDKTNARNDLVTKANEILLAALEPGFYTEGIE